MSKKKNTLKDLDEFLKQQAATIVTPPKLSDKIEVQETKKTLPPSGDITIETIIADLEDLAEQKGEPFRKLLYEFIIKSAESRDKFLPEDTMLINTALYLKNGDQWKDAIRQYWRSMQDSI